MPIYWLYGHLTGEIEMAFTRAGGESCFNLDWDSGPPRLVNYG